MRGDVESHTRHCAGAMNEKDLANYSQPCCTYSLLAWNKGALSF